MNKWGLGIVCILGIFYLACRSLGTTNYVMKDLQEREQLRLMYAIDYSVDAAVDALLESPDLNQDYSNEGKTDLDPNKALTAFLDVFLMNYDMSLTDQNRTHIKANYMPVFVVAVYDGYYMASLMDSKSATNVPENTPSDIDQDLIWSPKMPYKYMNAGISYGLNLGAKDYLRMAGNALTKEDGFPPGLVKKEDIYREINKIVSTDIAARMNQLNESNSNWKNSVYIPQGLTTLSKVNPIKGPSVIAFIQNLDLTTPRPINAFSVGGGRIQAQRYVAGYTIGAVKYYCYVDQVPNGTTIEEVFTSPRAAAQDGYFPDVKNLVK